MSKFSVDNLELSDLEKSEQEAVNENEEERSET